MVVSSTVSHCQIFWKVHMTAKRCKGEGGGARTVLLVLLVPIRRPKGVQRDSDLGTAQEIAGTPRHGNFRVRIWPRRHAIFIILVVFQINYGQFQYDLMPSSNDLNAHFLNIFLVPIKKDLIRLASTKPKIS
ncbi:hypothetical protein BHE74_00035609 [Ensete ventricosum]|nr:hypothetical protein BHE74_00035609 [Ensete ventricosum]